MDKKRFFLSFLFEFLRISLNFLDFQQLGDGVSLLLFSSEFFYDDMEFLAVAEVSFCDPINDFTYRWKVDGLELREIDEVLGNSLKLPAGTLASGKSMEVTVTALNSDNLTLTSVSDELKFFGCFLILNYLKFS